MYCGEHSAVKGDVAHSVVISLRCKSWLCPDCSPTRKAQLIAQGIGGNPTKFLTLTMRRRDDMTPEQAAKRLSWAWRVCRLRLMRQYRRKSIPFLAVVERHKSGWPHLHLLLRTGYIPQHVISGIMAELCDGPNVHIRTLDNPGRQAAYVAKYCAKCVEKLGTAKRYWQSRDYDQRPPDDPRDKPLPGEGWELWNRSIRAMAECFETWGYTVSWDSAHKLSAERAPP